MSNRLLVDHLRAPERLADADAATWSALIAAARAEAMIGHLHAVATGVRLPGRARTILDDAAIGIAHSRRVAAWEIEQASRALRPLGAPVVLLKGAAYLAAALPPAAGRGIGDLDILVPRAALADAEALLRAAGWESASDDGYDDAYYRRWMHELPPMIHAERGTVIDVHHSILPLTARAKPDAAALIADAVPIGRGLSILSPADMVVHSATHLFHDGDLEGGLRNLWDIHRLLGAFAVEPGFWTTLADRAKLHGLTAPIARALRFTRELFGTDVDPSLAGPADRLDPIVRARLLGRDRHGRRTAPLAAQALYIRSHWLRMPPLMLARHLATKALKRQR